MIIDKTEFENPVPSSAAILLLGVGVVGSAFLKQLSEQSDRYLRLVGVANSTRLFMSKDHLLPDEALQLLCRSDGRDLARAVDELVGFRVPIIVDATASESVARNHAGWLARGINVVTANKIAAANGWIQHDLSDHGHYGDAATVGAGLPLLSAIRRLRAAGDEIIRIEGILSGSLGYLFTRLEKGVSFTSAISEAQKLGYTEPDPQVDLSGEDVARKLTILAENAGLGFIRIPRPTPLGANTLADEYWHEQCALAGSQDRVLRYVASIDRNGTASIGVRALQRQDALTSACGADNCVAIYSRSYCHEPLVIRGPGAGADVTARALIADIADTIRLAKPRRQAA